MDEPVQDAVVQLGVQSHETMTLFMPQLFIACEMEMENFQYEVPVRIHEH